MKDLTVLSGTRLRYLDFKNASVYREAIKDRPNLAKLVELAGEESPERVRSLIRYLVILHKKLDDLPREDLLDELVREASSRVGEVGVEKLEEMNAERERFREELVSDRPALLEALAITAMLSAVFSAADADDTLDAMLFFEMGLWRDEQLRKRAEEVPPW